MGTISLKNQAACYLPALGLTMATGILSAYAAVTHSAIAFETVYVFGCLCCIFLPTFSNRFSESKLLDFISSRISAGVGYTNSCTSCLSAFEYVVET